MPLIAKEAGRESTTSFIGLAGYPIVELYHISGTKTLRNRPIIVVQKRKNKKQKQFVSQHPYGSLPLPSFRGQIVFFSPAHSIRKLCRI
jgi:hypothetical protein